jgi:hypothetical protein
VQLQQSAVLKVRRVDMGQLQLLCDFSTGSPRPLVPFQCRDAVFSVMHSGSHPGVRATKRLISARFVGPKRASDIAAHCRDSVECHKSKVNIHVRAPVQPLTSRCGGSPTFILI